MKINETNYGDFIKSRRKELSLTQNALAEALHCTPQAVSKYENGKSSIFLGMLGDLCKALEVDVDSFLEQKSEKNNDLCDKNSFSEKKFAGFLCFLREKEKKTQSVVSKEIDISQQKLSKWEKASSFPDLDELKILSQYYGLSASELYFSIFKQGDNHLEEKLEIKKEKNKKLNSSKILFTSILALLAISIGVLLTLVLHFHSSNSSSQNSSTQYNSSSSKTPPYIDSFYIE